jgi:hypothetical protein
MNKDILNSLSASSFRASQDHKFYLGCLSGNFSEMAENKAMIQLPLCEAEIIRNAKTIEALLTSYSMMENTHEKN